MQLRNGMLVQVPSTLVPRLPSHFISNIQSTGIDLILGLNGWIWVYKRFPSEEWNPDSSSTGTATEPFGGISTSDFNPYVSTNSSQLTEQDVMWVGRVARVMELLRDWGIVVAKWKVEGAVRIVESWERGWEKLRKGGREAERELVERLLSEGEREGGAKVDHMDVDG
jgi:exosome complex component RRP4